MGYDPHYVPTDSLFYNSGRVAGDVVSGIQGIAEIISGGGLGDLGGAACLRGGCVLTGPAIVAGSELIAHGIFVTGSGAINLGKDLTNFFAQENEGTGSAETGASGGGSTESVKASNPFKASETPKASDIARWAEGQGWKKTQTSTGPVKYVDSNGIPRVTIKQGSQRTPGSESPHVELRDSTGQRIDTSGNLVNRRSPGNHTLIDYDL